MSEYTKKAIVIIALSLIILLGILGYILLKSNLQGFLTNGENLPIRGLGITIDENQRDKLFNQLEKFSEKHALEFKPVFFDSNRKQFLVVMYGDGFHFSAAPVPNASQSIRIFLYNETSTSLSQEVIDDMFSDLKNHVTEIPNAPITEEK